MFSVFEHLFSSVYSSHVFKYYLLSHAAVSSPRKLRTPYSHKEKIAIQHVISINRFRTDEQGNKEELPYIPWSVIIGDVCYFCFWFLAFTSLSHFNIADDADFVGDRLFLCFLFFQLNKMGLCKGRTAQHIKSHYHNSKHANSPAKSKLLTLYLISDADVFRAF